MSWLAARLRSFGYAFSGLSFMLRTQGNAQAHLAVTLAAAAFGLWLGIGRSDWLWLILATALVWIAEALNTALEQLCDVVSPDRHEGIGRAKDISAAAVLAAAAAAATIGAMVFFPYF